MMAHLCSKTGLIKKYPSILCSACHPGSGSVELEMNEEEINQFNRKKGMKNMAYRDPTKEELESPLFNAIWNVIKTWDINVPEEYSGYCGATGNHVCAIMDGIIQSENEKEGK